MKSNRPVCLSRLKINLFWRTQNGLRYDLIAERIESLFNGAMDIGVGRIELQEINDISPAPKFHGVALEYLVKEYNRPTINGDPRSGVGA